MNRVNACASICDGWGGKEWFGTEKALCVVRALGERRGLRCSCRVCGDELQRAAIQQQGRETEGLPSEKVAHVTTVENSMSVLCVSLCVCVCVCFSLCVWWYCAGSLC